MDKPKIVLIVFVLLSFSLSKCNTTGNGEFVEKGYLLFDDVSYWYFVPLESMDTSNCWNFESDNFGKGLQFDPAAIPNLSYIRRTVDTLINDTSGSGSLKVTPVEIKFALAPRFSELYTSSSRDTTWNFRFQRSVEGRRIKFDYNIFPVKIHDVKPLFCLDMKSSLIHECPCKHKEDDPNDYLFKICNEIKKQDKYSDLPCKYGIKNVSRETVDGKGLIKVELTCCYLGDIAYFDGETKELVRISYGAQ